MEGFGIRPNYAELGRKYGMDWRTVKKYYLGYEGKPATRNKTSMLDDYREEIADKFKIRRVSARGVYEFMVKKYGLERIGSYPNFNRYANKHKLKQIYRKEGGHPRYEKRPGEQGQADWKEDISIANKYGEIFVINIFHITLKYSRYSYLGMSVQKRFEDVARCLVNAFGMFGGVPDEILFDNMPTVSNINARPKKPTAAITRFAKDYGFRVRLCGTRKPETKGTVEAKNKVLDWIRPYEGEFDTLEELDQIIGIINRNMNITVCQETEMSPSALFYKEKEYLKPLPAREIADTYLQPNRYKVSNESLITYCGNRYSVSPELIGLDVTADRLGDKLFIYYNGKLAAFHELNNKPINYKEEHYLSLMTGKANEEEMENIVAENLEIMDRLLESRKIDVSEKEAMKSEEALLAYLGQSSYGRWITNNYAHLSEKDRRTFIQGMNRVLPYVGDREAFISSIKYSMKANMCRTLDFDCYINDFMSADRFILTDEGYKIIGEKYRTEIQDFIEDLRGQNDTHIESDNGDI